MSYTADQAVEIFSAASDENRMSSVREQQVVILAQEGELWITGDLHDHRRNFDKLLAAADLPNNPQRHLLLQELIHGDYYDDTGADGSWQTLLRAAELKCDFPAQVHFLLANHDLAQIHGEGIMKAGMSVCEAFTKGIKNAFGSEYAKVNVAITEFLLSFPLAVRTVGGLFCCHSLPTDVQMDGFDYSVFGRELTGNDYKRRVGPVYQLIWGRNTTPEGVAKFAEVVGADILITGHQPQESGYLINGPQHLIIASDHNQGAFIQVDITAQYDMPALVRQIRRFVAIEL